MDLSCILVSICLFCSMFPISLAAKPDNHANDLTIQQIHDECLPESGDSSSCLGLFPPNPNGQSLDTPSAASPFLLNAELSAEQPPITAAEQNKCLQSGTSDIEDGEELLPRGQQDNIGRMETRTQALDLGWTFLRLTFQALLLMVICHFQAPSTSTSTSTSPLSSSSMRFHVIGAAMLIGFAFTMIGMSLHNAYPTASSIGEHTGMFSAAFGFLVMTGTFLPDRLNWSVLPVAGVVLFLGTEEAPHFNSIQNKPQVSLCWLFFVLIWVYTPSAASSFLRNAELTAEQPPTTAAEQNQCLQSGTSDIEDGEELLPRGHQDNIGRMETRTQALDLGWTFLRLTFQALLLMVICHFQAPSTSTSASPSTSTSTSPLSSSMRFHVIGAAMLIGFAFTMIGMLLRNAYPTAASIGEHTGMFSAAFGFLVMTGILLPDRLNWFVLPVAGVVLFIGFVFVLANIRQR
ncbi:hypothetical protein HYC85_014645 [Camellia sinensis]|uniref:EamA domain-containing protein n=1 Tax=Camellia sinensis TaxID=4442 RepID=A0A7J7HA52_CAMSI|nr:hypothetical protein HYC85_014645 [Camellia sinensis]